MGTPGFGRGRARGGLEVAQAYVEYQSAALPADSGEFIMVADGDQGYVAVTAGVTRVLGYAPEDLVGRRIGDIAAPEMREGTPELWDAFLVDGRQDGRFPLRASDGRVVWLRYQARAHYPVAGFHLSRLWPDDSPNAPSGV